MIKQTNIGDVVTCIGAYQVSLGDEVPVSTYGGTARGKVVKIESYNPSGTVKRLKLKILSTPA